MMISYGVFQQRNTRLTYNVEYDLWEAYIYVGVLPTYNTIVWFQMATYVMNQYSMSEVLSVTSTVDYMEQELYPRSVWWCDDGYTMSG